MSFPQSFALSLIFVGATSAFNGDFLQNSFPDRVQGQSRTSISPGAIAQTVEDERTAEAQRLYRIAIENYQQGLYRETLEAFVAVLEIYRELGDKPNIGKVLNDIGTTSINLGNYANAEASYEEALAIHQEVGNQSGVATTLTGLGLVASKQGRLAEAEEYYRQSLQLVRELGRRSLEATTLTNLGALYNTQGNYALAFEIYQQVLAIRREIGDRRGSINILNNLGFLYYSLGQYPKAEQLYQESFTLAEELGNKAGMAATLTNLGLLFDRSFEPMKARDFYERASQLHAEVGNRAWQAIAINNLGLVYSHLNDYDKASELYQQALSIVREIGDRPVEGTTLHNIGLIYDLQGQYDRAEQFYQEALTIRREVGDKAGEAITLHNLGILYQKKQQYNQAEQHLLASIEVRETLRPRLTDDQKISLLEQDINTYQALQNVLVLQNRPEAALEISERGRARSFVELLAQRLTNSSHNPIEVTPPNLSQIREIAAAQNATIVQYSIIADFTSMDADRQGDRQIYIWAIAPTGEIEFRRSDLSQLRQEQNTSFDKLVASARCFDNYLCRRNVTVANRGDGVSEVRSDGAGSHRGATEDNHNQISPQQQRQWQQLYQILIDPIADLLPTNPNDKVIFIPQDSLFLVPFPALQDANGQYLIEKHTILTAPSIQALEFTRQQQPEGEILIVGNPKMPSVGDPPHPLSPLLGAEKEAQDIAEMLQVTPLIGSEATESTVVEKMLSSRIIHLATHGSFDPDRGMNSWIALTPTDTDDGLLTAGEMFDLELKADLAILSACDTGRGKITGDGVIGLSRSLLSAGVSSVLVSLWQVPDDATYLLMREFYRNWQSGENKAQALRQAMLTTMQQYPSPENWAAFTLMGES